MRVLYLKLKKLNLFKLNTLSNACLNRNILGQTIDQTWDMFALEYSIIEVFFIEKLTPKLGKLAQSDKTATTSLKITKYESMALLNAILYYKVEADIRENATLNLIQVELEQFIHSYVNNIRNAS